MDTQQPDSKLPSLADIVASVALYKRIDITAIEPFSLSLLLSGFVPCDIYCIRCKRMSVFRTSAPLPTPKMVGSTDLPLPPRKPADKTKSTKHEDRDWALELICSRNVNHKIAVFFKIENDSLSKIGQYPSLADLQLHELSKYDRVLAESLRRDFARAIGLNAHGIGIGSFIYLRRIFEALVEDAHDEALKSPDWNDELFQKSKMDERVRLLKHTLPELLVANAAIYSILSKGVHTLSDDECLEYYDTLKTSIELILDEKIRRDQEQLARKRLSADISRIHCKLK